MTDRLSDARARVRGFLDTRAAIGGPIDQTVIHSVQRQGESHELLTADLEHLLAVTGGRQEPSIGTRSPSVRLPHDTALRIVRDAVDQAIAAEVRPVDLFRAVLMSIRGHGLGGNRDQVEAGAFAAIAEAETSPLDAMILQRGQAYADRGDYATVCVTRNLDHTISVGVVS